MRINVSLIVSSSDVTHWGLTPSGDMCLTPSHAAVCAMTTPSPPTAIFTTSVQRECGSMLKPAPKQPCLTSTCAPSSHSSAQQAPSQPSLQLQLAMHHIYVATSMSPCTIPSMPCFLCRTHALDVKGATR